MNFSSDQQVEPTFKVGKKTMKFESINDFLFLKGALMALNTLQSNAQAISSWIEQRRNNLNVDLKSEMLHGINVLGLDVSDFETKSKR